jgi:putative SOS response-associated peptidase YedK
MLRREDEDAWLDPGSPEPTLLSLLAPYDSGKTGLYRVGVRVNSVKNDDPECTAPVDDPAPLPGTVRP